MNIRLTQSEFCLSRRQTIGLTDGAGVRIDARAGALWVTQDHDPRDIVLRAGESFTLDGTGRAIVQAFESSRLILSQPAVAARRERVAERATSFLGALRRLLPRPAWS